MDEVRTPKAHTLVRDEKTVMLMVYTQQAMVRGEVVVKESIRVNIWMRTQGAPEYMHFINKPHHSGAERGTVGRFYFSACG